jgi:hypothetical protein
MRKIARIAAAAALATSITSAVCASDLVDTYDFVGTLTSSIDGDSSVTGQFSYDWTTNRFGQFTMNIPGLTFASSSGIGGHVTIYPSSGLGDPFTTLTFTTVLGDPSVTLLFDGDGPQGLAGGDIYPGPIELYSGTGETTATSEAQCVACPVPYQLGFSSGVATLASVPEPAEWALMLTGLAGLGAALRSRRRSAPAGAWYSPARNDGASG